MKQEGRKTKARDKIAQTNKHIEVEREERSTDYTYFRKVCKGSCSGSLIPAAGSIVVNTHL